jgi:hypothetical protein
MVPSDTHYIHFLLDPPWDWVLVIVIHEHNFCAWWWCWVYCDMLEDLPQKIIIIVIYIYIYIYNKTLVWYHDVSPTSCVHMVVVLSILWYIRYYPKIYIMYIYMISWCLPSLKRYLVSKVNGFEGFFTWVSSGVVMYAERITWIITHSLLFS